MTQFTQQEEEQRQEQPARIVAELARASDWFEHRERHRDRWLPPTFMSGAPLLLPSPVEPSLQSLDWRQTPELANAGGDRGEQAKVVVRARMRLKVKVEVEVKVKVEVEVEVNGLELAREAAAVD